MRPIVARGLLLGLGVLMVVGIRTYLTFQPAAITLGPSTTIYFTDDPPLSMRVHEAIHRRQMRDKSTLGRIWNALRYNFDYRYRLDEEAEAKAGEICLQIHRFSPELSAYTTARSVSQARAYRAWAWERMGMRVPDRVGEKLRRGENCHRILQGVELDLPPGAVLSESDALKEATLRFLQAYGSSEQDVDRWKARLELAGYVEPASWQYPGEVPPFSLVSVGKLAAPEPDTTIGPEVAGLALHRLTYSQADRMYTQLRPPLPGYRGWPLFEEDEAREAVGIPLERWPERILRRGLRGEFDEEEVAWLELKAAHPLHRDFEIFARAPAADIVGTRYAFGPDRAWERLAFSELQPIREAFRAQWGRAALAAHRGDLGGAREILRMTVAAALQMVEHAPFEVDVVEALEFLDAGLEGMRAIDRYQGLETPWLDAWTSATVEGWTRGVRGVLFSGDLSDLYRAMPALALDPGIPYAFKRLAYRQVVLTDVCLELREDRAPGGPHDRWRTAVELGLVRHESEQRVLELMRRKVRALMQTSAVPPHRVCSPERGVRPDARMAIIAAPLWHPATRASVGQDD